MSGELRRVQINDINRDLFKDLIVNEFITCSKITCNIFSKFFFQNFFFKIFFIPKFFFSKCIKYTASAQARG